MNTERALNLSQEGQDPILQRSRWDSNEGEYVSLNA